MSNCREADLRLNMALIIAALVGFYDYTVTAITTLMLIVFPDFSNAAQWTKIAVTVTGGIQNPLVTGVSNAFSLLSTVQNNYHGLGAIASGARTGTYTHSVYAKAGGKNFLTISDGAANEAVAIFNLSTGVVSTAPGFTATATITSVGNGWYRCTLTRTYAAEFVQFAIFCEATNVHGFWAGDGTGIYIYGPMFQSGAVATTYGNRVFVGTHALTAGSTVYITGVTPAAFNALTGVIAVDSTSFYTDAVSGTYTSGGHVTRSAKILMGHYVVDCDSDFLTDALFPFVMILPAENQDWEGQIRHFNIMIKMDLYFSATADVPNDFVAIENTWTTVRNALKLQSNYARTCPDRMSIDGPESRTDLKPMIFVYHFELIFPAGDP